MKRATTFLLTMMLLGLVGSTLAVIGNGTAAWAARPAVGPDRPARVLLYGDSLSSEAEAPFVDEVTRNGRAEVRTGVYGGTAICDWFDRMEAAAAWEPDAVVIEFSGNALTPCMAGAVGDAYWAKYQRDAEAVLAMFPGARIYLVGTPVSRGSAVRRDADAGRLNAMYAAIAGSHPGVEYVPAHQAVLLRGRYTEVLPCLTSEPCVGTPTWPAPPVNVVRAPDGAHFCPEPIAPAVNGVTPGCPVWSSGAYRFGTAMADPVVADLGL